MIFLCSILPLLKVLVFYFLRKCRYIRNIHPQVSETLLHELFSCISLVEGCKLVSKEKLHLLFVQLDNIFHRYCLICFVDVFPFFSLSYLGIFIFLVLSWHFSRMSYYMYVIVWSENDIILGTLKDLLSVCEGIVWEVT